MFAFIGGASLGKKSDLSEALSGMGCPQKLGTVPVSYSHPTLPTKRGVERPGGGGASI